MLCFKEESMELTKLKSLETNWTTKCSHWQGYVSALVLLSFPVIIPWNCHQRSFPWNLTHGTCKYDIQQCQVSFDAETRTSSKFRRNVIWSMMHVAVLKNLETWERSKLENGKIDKKSPKSYHEVDTMTVYEPPPPKKKQEQTPSKQWGITK